MARARARLLDVPQVGGGPAQSAAPVRAPAPVPQVAAPGPQPVAWNSDDLKRRSKMITKLYPSMKSKPKIVMTLASQDIPDDHLASSVMKTAGFEIIQAQAKVMPTLSPKDQRRLWDQAEGPTRHMLKQAGYHGPPAEDSGGSIFDNLLDVGRDLPVVSTIRKAAGGDLAGAAEDIPGVGGAIAAAKGESVMNVLGKSTGANQLVNQVEKIGPAANVTGQVAGGALREVGLADVADAAHSASTFAEQDVASPVLRGLNLSGGALEHVFRMNEELAKGTEATAVNAAHQEHPDQVKAGAPGPNMGGVSDPFYGATLGALARAGIGLVTGDTKPIKHLDDAWERTSNGNRYFNDKSVWDASETLDHDAYSIEAAKQLAGGSSVEDLALKYGPKGSTDFQDNYLKITGLQATADFGKAVKQLNNGRVSHGQDAVRGLGIPIDSAPGQALSMATDGVIAWYADPLIVAGKMREAYKAKEAIQTIEGVKAAESTAARAVEAVHGADWEAKLKRGEITLNDVTKESKQMGTAAEMAQAFVENRGRTSIDQTPLYDFFNARFPRFEKTLKPLVDLHESLIRANTTKAVEEAGRPLTADELAAVPGIESSKDIWDFYKSLDGAKTFAGPGWQPGRIGNFYLPSLTRTDRALGDIRAVMTTSVQKLAARGVGAAMGLEPAIGGGLEGNIAAVEALEPAAEGTTRLFRVQVGTDLFGESRGGRDAEKLTWFNDIERARASGLGLGEFGQFTYADVPESVMAESTNMADEAHRNIGMDEWLLPVGHGVEPVHLGPIGDWADIGGQVKPAAFGLLAAPARLTQALMARVPEQTFRLWGNDTPTQLSRLLDLEYGGAAKAQMYEAIVGADSPIMRREMMRSALDRIMYSNGMYLDDTARDVAAGYLKGLDQGYALDGLDMMPVGSARVPGGIGPWSDHGDEISMPSFKEMSRQSKRMGVLHQVLGPSQAPMWDAVIGRFWKPSMLFRLGFAPRAAAEESIVNVLHAPHIYTEGALLRLAKAGGEPVMTYRDVNRLAKGLEVYMPEEVAANARMHPIDKLASYLGNYARGWIRGMATDRINPETLLGSQMMAEEVMRTRGATIMAENAPIQHSIMDYMAKVGSSRANWDLPEQILFQAGQRAPTYYVATSPEGAAAIAEAKRTGEPLVHPDVRGALPVSSGMDVYEGADPMLRAMVHNQADRFMGDHVQRAVGEARQLYVDQSEAEAAVGPLTSRGIDAANGHDALNQAREAMASNEQFTTTYRHLMTSLQRTDSAERSKELADELTAIANYSGDQRLIAVAGAAPTLPPGVGQTLLLDKNDVLRKLARVEVPLDPVEMELNSSALALNPKKYGQSLVRSLPDVEPNKVRVFARAGVAADERTLETSVRAAWRGTDLGDTPWKYGSFDPQEVLDQVEADAKAAANGRVTHTDHLIFVDVDPRQLATEDGRPILTAQHKPDAVTFGNDIGTQLEDMRNATIGVDGARARRWSDLAEAALNGDEDAARELGVEAGKRQLQHPVNLRRVREMLRGLQDSSGNIVVNPVAEGLLRVYFPTFRADEADAAFMAADTTGSTGRRFVDLRKDLSPTNRDAYLSVGDGPLFAHSTYASTDGDEVRQLVQQIEEDSAKVGHHLSAGMSYMDVPEEQVYQYYRDTRGAGSHDYEIRFGDSLNATPVDLDGKIVTTPPVTRPMTEAEFVRAAEFRGGGDAAEFQRRFEAGTVPSITIPGQLQNGTTFEQAMGDYADILNARFDQLFEHEGRVIHELTVPGTQMRGMDPMWVFNRATPMPPKVLGPQVYTPTEESIVPRTINWGMDKAITPLTNAMSRNPLYLNNAFRRVGFAENMLRPMMADSELATKALNIAHSTLGIESADELYSAMRDLPKDMKTIERLVDERRLGPEWLNLSHGSLRDLHGFFDNEQLVRQTVAETAAHGAYDDTIPWIADHHTRSQFADEIRNLVPFWWAQEAFLRRWAGTIEHSPEAIRKAQLIMQGARHVGFIYKDDQGKDSFMIPFSNEILKTLAAPISMFFGGPATMPVPMGISGQVRMAVPGLNEVGVPGPGPLAGIPISLVRRIFPEVGAIEKGLMGEQAAGRNPLEYIIPSWMVKSYQAITANPDGDTKDSQLASASIMAMQYLEANGHGLKKDATTREQQDYIDRVTNWSRSILVARAIVGMADPAPAQLEVGQPEMNAEFATLMKNVGIHDALSVYLKRHPDATAYSIFQSKSTGSSALPATAEAEDFMLKNKDFIDKYQFFSGWTLPQSGDQDANLRSARALQKSLGLRDTKTPAEWYTDFKFGEAADVYFNSKTQYEISREKLHSSQEKAEIDQQWAKWKKDYFAQHPVFSHELQNRSGQDRRATVMQEMHQAYSDPLMPDFPHKAELKGLMDSYDRYLGALKKLSGRRGTSVSDERKDINEQFAAWAVKYTTDHPETRLFYQRVIYPDVDLKGSERQKYDTQDTAPNRARRSAPSATPAPALLPVPQVGGSAGGGGSGGGGGAAAVAPATATDAALRRDGLPVLQPTGKEKPKVFKGDKHPGLWQVQQQQLADLQRQYPGADITMVDNSHRKGGGQWWVTPDPDPDKKYVPVKRPASRTV